MKYDIEEMKRNVPIEDVLDRFGIPMKRKGKETYVLCPFHNDEHFGSAKIWQNGIKCFAENEWYSVLDVYMNQYNCSFKDAVKMMSNDYGISGSTDQERELFPFRKEELLAIGLISSSRREERYPMLFLEECASVRGTLCLKDKNGEWYLSGKGSSMSQHLRSLFKDDKVAFKWLVENKCKESYKFYKNNLIFLQALSNALCEIGVTDITTDAMLDICISNLKNIESCFKTLKGC